MDVFLPYCQALQEYRLTNDYHGAIRPECFVLVHGKLTLDPTTKMDATLPDALEPFANVGDGLTPYEIVYFKIANTSDKLYVPPEISCGKTASLPCVDLWCLGVSLLSVVFDGSEPEMQQYISGTENLPCDLGDGARSLLGGLLQREPRERKLAF